MTAFTPARSTHPSTRCGALFVLRRSLGGALLALLLGGAALAQEAASEEPEAAGNTGPAPETSAEGRPVFSLGPLEYRAARGFRFGDSGLTIGGFSTLELDRLRAGPTALAIDSLNFLALYEPVDSFRVFAELEIGGLLAWDSAEKEVDSSPHANFERLYAEYSASDALNLRFGKFQTPVGRWNLAPAEPFTWLSTQPAILEFGLDEHQTGVALFGSFYPEKRVLSYWVYGQVLDAFDEEGDDIPAHRSVGGRIEYGDARGAWSFGGSLLASELAGAWSTAGGVDAKWRMGERLELSSEWLVSRGDIPDRDYWGAFVEAAYPLDQLSPKLAKLYLVGRFEHFDVVGDRPVEIIDFGLTWLPAEWLNLKAGYRVLTHRDRNLSDELKISISVLF